MKIVIQKRGHYFGFMLYHQQAILKNKGLNYVIYIFWARLFIINNI